ncbi:MAG TPA: ArsR family transcriptional regulator [Candidatus Thermoplasmatota archaeon]|nr:ArsR family transcriptional regulator [Candidatus Thermoplasmatota archaeon]
MPTPQGGDAWSYSAVLTGDWVLGGNDTIRLGQEFPAYELHAGSTTIRLLDGFIHDATRVDVHGLHYSPLLARIDLDPQAYQAWSVRDGTAWFGTSGLVARETNGPVGNAGGYAGAGAGPLGIPLSGQGSAVTVAERLRVFDGPEPCLARNGLQGREVSTQGDHRLFPACRQGGSMLEIGENMTFHAAALEQVSGMPALRFDATDGGGTQAWFNPGIPYPVQLVQATGGHSVTLRLSGFQPGSTPWTADEHPRAPVPALVWADAKPWGPDDSGLPLPFGLSQAFESARTDPSFPDLQEFLTAHPDARATDGSLRVMDREIQYATFSQPDGADRTWFFTISDRNACLRFSATQEERPGQLPMTLPVGQMGGPQKTYTNAKQGKCDVATPAAKWPTAASATALWQAYASPAERERGANGITFSTDQSGTTMEAGEAANAGHEVTRHDVSNSVSITTSPAGGRLVLIDGRVDHIEAYDAKYSSYSEFAGIRSEDGAPAHAAAPLRPASQSVAATFAMPPETAVGIGLFAILAGAVAWIWPNGLPFAGLFSRVHGHSLLEHPVRADLTQRIEAAPGIHYQELVRATGAGKGAIEHHLRKLEASGLVKVLRTSGYSCYFPVGTSPAVRQASPALKSEGARKVLAAIRGQPGISGMEVRSCTGLGAATVSEHLARLTEAGLVLPERDGRMVRLRATALAEQIAAA